ncbi:NADPH-dependent FMN reductase [Pelagibacterium halotolerans]|uniref:NADPH-dependent FMN reductase n=1 Tax=Pelagibacterium halotolerans TaxID=531813 RepID=UPI00384CDFF8
MRFLAISGSARRDSTNTALLHSVRQAAPPGVEVVVFDGIASLPVFSPDLEGAVLPAPVQMFMDAIAASDGVIISSPEYVRAIPGGLKNAIDWLVSGDLIIAKPIALLHASHRGDDMLANLRVVLSTVSYRFNEELFLRLHLMKMSPDEIARTLAEPENRARVQQYLQAFAEYCRG